MLNRALSAGATYSHAISRALPGSCLTCSEAAPLVRLLKALEVSLNPTRCRQVSVTIWKVWGAYASPRVVFGVRVSGTLPQRGSLCPPNTGSSGRDAGKCTRGRVRSPEMTANCLLSHCNQAANLCFSLRYGFLCSVVDRPPTGYFAARFPSIMSTQIGRASSPPVPPDMIFLGWSKPTQAPQTSWSSKPTNQASW